MACPALKHESHWLDSPQGWKVAPLATAYLRYMIALHHLRNSAGRKHTFHANTYRYAIRFGTTDNTHTLLIVQPTHYDGPSN